MEEKIWLYPENETPYVFNEDKELLEIESKIIDNVQALQQYASRNKRVGEREEKMLSGISAVQVEKEYFRDDVDNGTMTQDDLKIADGFLVAQEMLLNILKKEPYLYSELFQPLHVYLVKDNLDISDYDKGHFRDRYSNSIQVGYFEPTPGSQVRTEINMAFSQYAYVDRTGKDNVFEKIAKLHAQIVRIQPFMDGNKRIAFLATNGMLKLHGLPLIGICSGKDENESYNDALKKAIVGRDVTDLAKIIAGKVLSIQNKKLDKLAAKEVKENLQNLYKTREGNFEKPSERIK